MATHQQTVRTWPLVLYSLSVVVLALHQVAGLSSPIGYGVSNIIANGATVGGCCMLLILGGLCGRVWMQGAMAAIAIGVSCCILADVRDYTAYYNPVQGLSCASGIGLRGPYVPAVLFVGSSPFLLSRYWMGWRLTRNAHELSLPRISFGVDDLLQITAVIASAVFLLQVPNTVYEFESEWGLGLDHMAWFGAWQLCGFSLLLVPLVCVAFRAKSVWRFAAMLGLSPIVVYLYGYCLSNNWDAVVRIVAALVVSMGLVAFYFSGFRLAQYAPKLASKAIENEIGTHTAQQAFRNRRLNRYLATGFVTTSIAVCCATGALLAQRAKLDSEQQRLRFEIAERGGKLEFQRREAYRLKVDERASDDFLKNFGNYIAARELSLEGSQISDAAIADLKQFERLTSLNLNGTKVTDACLDELCKLTNIYELKIGGTSITRQGRMRILKELDNLSSLDVSDLGVDDEELNEFPYRNICEFGALYLRNNPISDAGVSRMLAPAASPEVGRLDLSGTLVSGAGVPACHFYQLILGGSQVTDKSISQLLSKPVEGTSLILQNTTITDAVLPQLLRGSFSCVEIGDCPITEACFAQEAFQTDSELQNFSLTGKQFTGEFFQHWRRRVNCLNMQGSGVTDETLKYIANLPAISGLSLKGTGISDAGILHLKRFKEFAWLDVSDTQVTTEGLISSQLKCRFISVASGQFTTSELQALSACYQVEIDMGYADF